MFRIANLVVVLALLVTAAVVYQVKYASTADAERLAHLRQAIRAERDAIAVMRAEWAKRTSPLFVQGLVQRHLDLQPLAVDGISTLDDLPEKVARKQDGIGGMIEELVDTPLVTSSVNRSAPTPSVSAPAAGGAAVLPASSALRSPSTPVTPKPTAAPTGTGAPQASAAPVRTTPVAPRAVAPAPAYVPPSTPAPAQTSSSGAGGGGLAPMLPPAGLTGGR